MNEYPDTPFQTWLEEHNACPAAREWVGARTPKQAWTECERIDWMDWLSFHSTGRYLRLSPEEGRATADMSADAAAYATRVGVSAEWTARTARYAGYLLFFRKRPCPLELP